MLAVVEVEVEALFLPASSYASYAIMFDWVVLVFSSSYAKLFCSVAKTGIWKSEQKVITENITSGMVFLNMVSLYQHYDILSKKVDNYAYVILLTKCEL